MQTKQIDDNLSVSAQIAIADIAAIGAAGFRSIINNRPDHESIDQPTSDTLQTAATRAGLAYRHIPVEPGTLHDAQAEDFRRALDELPRPVLAFCRSGARSTMLWALNAARNLDTDCVLRTASAAGYDLTALRPRLLQAHGSK